MTSTDSQPGKEVATVVSPGTLALFAQMAVNIPEANDDEAYEEIVLTLLGAEGLDGLNAPWDTDASEKLSGKRLKIEEITRRPSDFAGGLGMYLVCKGIVLDNGEKFTWSTGSVAIVAQLARAHFLNAFPVIAELIIAETTTAKGYRPQHMKIHAFGGGR